MGAAILGFIFLAIVLLVFFYDLRTALISLIAIPLSLVAAGLVLYFTGATFNMIVLTGFVAAIGVVVYDSIIDAEHIVRRHGGSIRMEKTPAGPHAAILTLPERAASHHRPARLRSHGCSISSGEPMIVGNIGSWHVGRLSRLVSGKRREDG